MIELSFITCVVAFIGQLLARRAFQKEPNPGVTLAEISMRSWIVSQMEIYLKLWTSSVELRPRVSFETYLQLRDTR